MNGLAKTIIVAGVSFAGGAAALKKKQVGGTYFKFWKKEFWKGAKAGKKANRP